MMIINDVLHYFLNCQTRNSRFTLFSLSRLAHSALSLMSRHSTVLIFTKIRHSHTHAHKRVHKQSQVPGLTFSTVYGTPLGTSAIVGHLRKFWALSQNLPIPHIYYRHIYYINIRGACNRRRSMTRIG